MLRYPEYGLTWKKNTFLSSEDKHNLIVTTVSLVHITVNQVIKLYYFSFLAANRIF